MNRAINNAFDDIKADRELISKTLAFINGQIIKRQKRRMLIKTSALACAAVLLFALTGLFGYNALLKPGAYISIDVNPSIELTLNRNNAVINSLAFNKEGEELLKNTDIAGKGYEKAVEILITAINEKGYFDNNPLVSLTVQAQDESKSIGLCERLKYLVDNKIKDLSINADIEAFNVSADIREKAINCHVSPAKYLAVKELMEFDKQATPENYADYDIRQIRQRTMECRDEHENGANKNHGADEKNSVETKSGVEENHHNKGQSANTGKVKSDDNKAGHEKKAEKEDAKNNNHNKH